MSENNNKENIDEAREGDVEVSEVTLTVREIGELAIFVGLPITAEDIETDVTNFDDEYVIVEVPEGLDVYEDKDTFEGRYLHVAYDSENEDEVFPLGLPIDGDEEEEGTAESGGDVAIDDDTPAE